MSKPRSRKAKGKRLQGEVRDLILRTFLDLERDDVVSSVGSEQGTDIKLSPKARKVFPFSIECKNQEHLSIWQALEQSESAVTSDTESLLVFRRNRSKTYVVLELKAFMSLAKGAEPRTAQSTG
jgi:hypothetical protein